MPAGQGLGNTSSISLFPTGEITPIWLKSQHFGSVSATASRDLLPWPAPGAGAPRCPSMPTGTPGAGLGECHQPARHGHSRSPISLPAPSMASGEAAAPPLLPPPTAQAPVLWLQAGHPPMKGLLQAADAPNPPRTRGLHSPCCCHHPNRARMSTAESTQGLRVGPKNITHTHVAEGFSI